ncbi:MAG: glycosyltransferase [Bacteroidales bacterium]|nr:glycosyltransferase [Bacteroidales bacterium]
MKILIINKSDSTGGAAIAARRLKDALQANGHEVKMLVQEKLSDDDTIFSTGTGKLKKYQNFLLFILERLYFLFYEKSKALRFSFSPAIAGENISNHPLVLEADVIHLHWFNQGFLSLKNLNQLLKLNKKTVWTLHDMWAFTGGCHYSGDCSNYTENCGNCKFLKHPAKNDLSARILKQKRKIIKKKNIEIVTCSHWLAEKARESDLLKGFTITAIPNAINTTIFCPKDKSTLRTQLNLPIDKKLILFGSANIMDERKGLRYLVSAIKRLKQENPALAENSEILLFGKSDDSFIEELVLKVNNLGIIKGESLISDIYAAADVFVLPSLEDNLPNTIMESLSCGTPTVAFNSGGIPEMIDHQKNGYLAEYKSVEELSKGIEYVLVQNDDKMNKLARGKVIEYYNQKRVAENYTSTYLNKRI